MDKKYKVGYTTGVFDLFHIGHLNILKRAKEMCDYLIAGISTDECVKEYKHKRPVITFEERVAIVEAIKYVDKVVPQENMDKLAAYKKHQFNVVFVGDDWKGSDKWNKIEAAFAKYGVDVVYFPYTQNTSSTLLIKVLKKLAEKEEK